MTTGWSPWAQHHKHHGHKSNRIFLYIHEMSTKHEANQKRKKKMNSSQSNYREPCVIWCVSHSSFDVWPFQYDALAICATWPNHRAAVEAQNFSIRKNHTIIIIDRFDRFIVISLRSLFCFFIPFFLNVRTFIFFFSAHTNFATVNRISQQLWCGFRWTDNHSKFFFFIQSLTCHRPTGFFSLFTNSKPLNIIIDKCAASNHFQWRRKKQWTICKGKKHTFLIDSLTSQMTKFEFNLQTHPSTKPQIVDKIIAGFELPHKWTQFWEICCCFCFFQRQIRHSWNINDWVLPQLNFRKLNMI